MNNLPIKLTNLRKHYNYSQQYIAKVLGVDIVDYMGIENGRNVLNYEQMLKLSRFYHIDVIELFRNDINVTLYEVNKQDTDQVNIDYFIPKPTLSNSIKKFIKKNLLFIGFGIGAIAALIIIFIVSNIAKVPLQDEIINKNRLSVSNDFVVYLKENGAVSGSGDNSNSQISNLPTENVVKVVSGDNYTISLLNNGTVYVCGDIDDNFRNQLNKLKNIVDIESGDNHVLVIDNKYNISSFGDNKLGQCDVSDFSYARKIFAGDNASVAIDKDGNLMFAGEFVGRSSIQSIKNIVDIDFSSKITFYLKDDGTTDFIVTDNSNSYYESNKWKNVVDVACGKDFLVGLLNDGSVKVASDDESLVNSVIDLKNIIAIDACDDYFVCYDGFNIYGFGNAIHNQFTNTNSSLRKLSVVSNINTSISKGMIVLSFDPVNNAVAYEVNFNNISNIYTNNKNITLDASSLEKGNTYIISIKSIGEKEYINSDIFDYEFVYDYEENAEPKDEKIVIQSNISEMTKDQFESYLRSIGINNIEAIETSEYCSGDIITISDIEGINGSNAYSKLEIGNVKVKYRYCKINVEENIDEENMES